MKRKEFDAKYDAVIRSVATVNAVDMGVGSDMLISSIRGYNGETYSDANGVYPFDTYAGIPEDFNWEEAAEDYKKLVKVV